MGYGLDVVTTLAWVCVTVAIRMVATISDVATTRIHHLTYHLPHSLSYISYCIYLIVMSVENGTLFVDAPPLF